MIRYKFIEWQVLEVYSSLPIISFPIKVEEIIKYIPECRFMTYQEFAKINNCSIDDVIQLCESKSGCTHYDILKNRYLILCNNSTDNNNNLGRQRWTIGHEIGHIECKHLPMSAYEKLSKNGFFTTENSEFESEADYFAAMLLAPFPLFKTLHIASPIDIQNIFGLSCEASFYRYKQYLSWKNNKIKTSWENDIINIYNHKKILP